MKEKGGGGDGGERGHQYTLNALETLACNIVILRLSATNAVAFSCTHTAGSCAGAARKTTANPLKVTAWPVTTIAAEGGDGPRGRSKRALVRLLGPGCDGVTGQGGALHCLSMHNGVGVWSPITVYLRVHASNVGQEQGVNGQKCISQLWPDPSVPREPQRVCSVKVQLPLLVLAFAS